MRALFWSYSTSKDRFIGSQTVNRSKSLVAARVRVIRTLIMIEFVLYPSWPLYQYIQLLRTVRIHANLLLMSNINSVGCKEQLSLVRSLINEDANQVNAVDAV